jgi:phosphoglycerate dehydrogenase-like enzyme
MKLVIAARWQEPGCVDVCAAFPGVGFAVAKTPEELARETADAEAIFGWPHAEAIQAAKRLRWVQAHSAGMDWMAGNAPLIESDVVVTSMGAAFAPTMVEHVFALLLFLTRGVRYFDAEQRRRAWTRPIGTELVGLSGRTLGVLGFGNIGRGVAGVGHALGMRVIAVDANDVPRPGYLAQFWRLEGLPALLHQSDVLVVTVPLTPATRGMLAVEQLRLLKPSAYVIGISRGEIIDEQAVGTMLREGRLAGAALDSFAVEPLPQESPLWDAPNLVLTPHCSGVSQQTTDGCWQVLRENLGRYLDGRPLLNVFDKRRGY